MILVLGGTSDSLLICDYLNKMGVNYKVTVTTEYGKTLALQSTSNVLVGALDLQSMSHLILKDNVHTIIDATHPYAIEVSKTAIEVAKKTDTYYVRYERESLLEKVSYDKLYVVQSIQEACEAALSIGNRIFLSTGSKNLESFWKKLTNKTLIARVLPTSDVLKMCENIGFNADQIVAMKGPFSKVMNEATYSAYEIDLVITKESGQEGGFLEKIEACKSLDIPVVVIQRATLTYPYVVHHIEDILKR
ncbi:precorrin-6A reductase [Cellulosilyticum sp. I15G10I2]|uniref:precorrin-6A reductase n=1 Tax=Cellulosilyticum sp. I15G10I2 TaxID=1892843 RepID=UPI00085C647A|nr:precorrin-6A reductase [Cellulosilyticum sp. I15G10I2]